MGLEGTRFDLKTLPEELRDTTRWPDVDIGALHGRKRKKYLQRREAIQLYFKGEDKVVDICTKCKISDTFLHYLRDRCLMDHRNGWIWGFRALVPGQHVEIQGRTKPVSVQPEGTKSGYRGALTQLFDRYPSIWRYVRALFLKKARQMEGSIAESRAPYKSIHKKFIDACRSKGLKGSDYPLCTDDQGRKSLTKHLNNLFNSDMEAAVAAQFGKDAARKLGSGEDYKKHYETRPYSTVEFDAHSIDASWIIKVPDRFKGYLSLVLSRIWLLVIIDRYSAAILGYYLCLKEQYNQFDVMRCVKRAIEPWRPFDEFEVEGFQYPPMAGFPSGVIKRFFWAIWDLLVYDNALANIASNTRKVIKEATGGDVNAGPKYVRDHQPNVEKWFDYVESEVFHRLPNTHGTDPEDPRRNDPEKAAIDYEMTINHLREIVELVIAKYNIRPHSGRDGLAPLEILDRYAADETTIIKTLPANKRSQLAWMNIRETRVVRGDLSKGRRPYIHFYGGNYTNEVLAKFGGMIGETITLVFDPTEDIRSLIAYFGDGRELGVLSVRGAWSRSAHSLDLRREINKWKKRQKIHYTETDDIVHLYLAYLHKQAVKNKKARSRLAAAIEIVDKKRTSTVPSASAEKPGTRREGGVGEACLPEAIPKRSGRKSIALKR